MSNWIVFESIFVFVVWMQRKGRWAAFLKAASGQVVVGGTDRSGSVAYSEDSNGKVLPVAGSTASGVSSTAKAAPATTGSASGGGGVLQPSVELP